jgi:hypothetical protein
MRNYLYGFLIWLFALPVSAKAEDVLLIDKFDRDGAMRYSVPREAAAHLPRWESTKQAVPMSQQSAVQIAEKHLRKAYPYIKQWAPRVVSLSSSIRTDKNYVWYYSVTLQQADVVEKGLEKTVIVLLDGSIVKPAPLQKKMP